MKTFYINIELDIKEIIFEYKNITIIIINKKEICPDTNTSQ